MAAAGGHIQRLCDEATCSICLDYFKDPVTSPECGHNFCRSCLIQYWGESEAEASCPQCRQRVQSRSLIPNRQLANMVELIENLSVQEGKGDGVVCKEHKEPLKLFCKVHEAPICLVCDRSKEHENHKVIPLEEASEEYKGEICRHLEILRKEREEILAYQANLDKESKDLLDVRSTLQRCSVIQKVDSERESGGFGCCFFNKMSVSVSWLPAYSSLSLIFSPTANVTLDPDTAHRWLILSEDRKSLRRGDEDQDLPNNPERFNYRPCVLGREEFTAGRHFWEVNVESGEWWDVGVARKSVTRKGFFSLRPEEGIWAVGNRADEYLAFTSPDDSCLSLRTKPRRIRVTLDYEGGRVSFYDSDSGAELYTFSGASFSGETLLPFFCLWGKKTPLRIS
nr:E3 ubiquitin-protein ligase TRIM39-like [Zootoca vivipara]